LAGLSNVNTHSIYHVGVKFIGANSLWLVLPPLVIAWGARLLINPAEAFIR